MDILYLNVRGLRKTEKRRIVFSYLKKQKASIFCLHESERSQTKKMKLWRPECNYHT